MVSGVQASAPQPPERGRAAFLPSSASGALPVASYTMDAASRSRSAGRFLERSTMWPR